MPTSSQTAAIALAAHCWRPDWPAASLRAGLERHYACHDAERVLLAVWRAAQDPSARTPGVLTTNPAYWRPAGEQMVTPPPAAQVLAGQPPTDLAAARAGVAACRAELDRATRPKMEAL